MLFVLSLPPVSASWLCLLALPPIPGPSQTSCDLRNPWICGGLLSSVRTDADIPASGWTQADREELISVEILSCSRLLHKTVRCCEGQGRTHVLTAPPSLPLPPLLSHQSPLSPHPLPPPSPLMPCTPLTLHTDKQLAANMRTNICSTRASASVSVPPTSHRRLQQQFNSLPR